MLRNNRAADNRSYLIAERGKTMLFVLLAVAITQLVIAACAQAAVITVNNDADAGVGCTLRDAVTAINQSAIGNTGCFNAGPFSAVDTIVFDANVNTITLSNSSLDIFHGMRILSTNGVTIESEADNRLMTINVSFVELVGITFIGNVVSGFINGGVIYVNTGVLVMRDSVISGARIRGAGGGLYIEGGANVALFDTTVTNNFSEREAGAISIRDSSSLELFDSNISNNTANANGGGIYSANSSVTVSNSTISGNESLNGGGLFLLNSNGTISNSTISGNVSGVGAGGIRATRSSASLFNTTVAENIGGGIITFSSNISLFNSIFANPSSVRDCDLVSGSVIANNHNIIADGSCNTSANAVNPRLGPLADNGGPTQTHALLANSPAIGAGDNAVCAASPVNNLDQRGHARPNPVGTTCDLGGYESDKEVNNETQFYVVPTKNGKSVIFGL